MLVVATVLISCWCSFLAHPQDDPNSLQQTLRDRAGRPLLVGCLACSADSSAYFLALLVEQEASTTLYNIVHFVSTRRLQHSGAGFWKELNLLESSPFFRTFDCSELKRFTGTEEVAFLLIKLKIDSKLDFPGSQHSSGHGGVFISLLKYIITRVKSFHENVLPMISPSILTLFGLAWWSKGSTILMLFPKRVSGKSGMTFVIVCSRLKAADTYRSMEGTASNFWPGRFRFGMMQQAKFVGSSHYFTHSWLLFMYCICFVIV